MRFIPIGSLVLGLVSMVWPATAVLASQPSTVKLIDMYAKEEGAVYRIYIMASGDISNYRTSRELRADSYKLILDVPALPPIESKYDLRTPFSRRFEVWPMKLGEQVYSRIAMELDLEASSVIGQNSPARIFITISRNSETSIAASSANPGEDGREDLEPNAAAQAPAARASAPSNPPKVSSDSEPESIDVETPSPGRSDLEVEPTSLETDPSTAAPGEITDGATAEPSEPENTPDSADVPSSPPAHQNPDTPEFYSLFPVPVRESRYTTDLGIQALTEEASLDGIRLGRFLMRPSVLATFMKGSNVLLQQEDFEDSVLHMRGRAAFDLLESDHTLRLAYEIRYQQYGEFELTDNFSHLFDFDTSIHVTPTTLLEIQNHLIKGSYESYEFDPGREVPFSFDPFIRNLTRGTFRKDVSERMGFELYGGYNHVQFLEETQTFFDYDTTVTGGSFLYHLSPLTSLFGSYERVDIPSPTARPLAQSTGDSLLMGLRGEITPLLSGKIRVGFRDQEFGDEETRQSFRGLVADISLTRHFGERTLLDIQGGRMTSLSNFQENNYFVSNYLNVIFGAPVTRDLRLTTGASLFGNDYPLPGTESEDPRSDRATILWLGGAYYFSRRGFLEVNYRHERRNSNVDEYNYRNNVIMFLVGFGYL